MQRFIVVVVSALILAGTAQAKGLPPHQGHPILPVSAKEAARERALPKSSQAHKVIYGINDPTLTSKQSLASVAPLHLGQIAITLNWSPASVANGSELGAIPDTQPVLLILQGTREDSPSSPFARAKFCEYANGLLWLHRNIRELQIWNEPIASAFFWKGNRRSYLDLLATCFDSLHGRVKILAPGSHPNQRAQLAFVSAVRAYYRQTDRKRPLFDGYSVHPYWNWATRPIARAMNRLWRGLPQRSPNHGLRFWWTETGMESDVSGMPAPGYRRGYSGQPHHWLLSGTATQQASRVALIARLAQHDPLVAADFNFLLYDEQDLTRWQSGLLYIDGTPKPAFRAFQNAIKQG
jgi:hypothetical protein